MKLKDWANKTGIKYLTAYRWFRAGTLPVKSYQTDSGTIIVQDESETSEPTIVNQSNDAMSMVLKKTVEFSKNNGTIEDFAAWVLSNFSLKLGSNLESPRYSKVKPKGEKPKPKPNMFVAPPEDMEKIVEQENLSLEGGGAIHKIAPTVDVSSVSTAMINDDLELNESLLKLFSPINTSNNSNISIYDNTGGLVTGCADSTPQCNYTSSNNTAFSTNSSDLINNIIPQNSSVFVSRGFEAIQKNTDNKIADIVDKPRRGRKPSKNYRKP